MEIKDNKYLEDVYNMLKKNNYSTENYVNNLKTLRIIKDPIESAGIIDAAYDPKRNQIVYYKERGLPHEIIHVASSTRQMGLGIEIKNGLTGEHLGKGLNEGITDMFTKMADNDSQINYPIEVICAETLKEFYGKEIYNSYFENNPKKFISQFDPFLIQNLLMELDNYQRLFILAFNQLEEIEIDEKLSNKTNYFAELKTSLEEVLDILSELACLGNEKINFGDFIKSKFNKPETKEIVQLINSLSTRDRKRV